MRKLVVLGGGESGYGAAILAKKQGWDVFLSDSGRLSDKYRAKLEEWGIPFEEGGHSEERIMVADEAVKSPGIPDDAPMVAKLCGAGIPVISEIEFAGRYMNARTICITGSNGKTTTTALTYRILKDAGFNVGVAGNIGDSLSYQVATEEYDWYVIEVSSFQLDGMAEFKADISVLLNITPDHLDRYGHSMELYVDSKMRVVRNQSYDDYFVYCEDDGNIMSRVSKGKLSMRLLPFSLKNRDDHMHVKGHEHGKWNGAHMAGDDFYAVVGEDKFVMPVAELGIKGKHNIYNSMAATLAAMAAGVPMDSIRKTLAEFGGVEHRLEQAGEIDGVLYINDSKATNTDAVWYALESMDRPVVWIAGGTDKGNDYGALKELAGKKVRVLICLGADNSKLKREFDGVVPRIYEAGSMDDALSLAKQSARSGDTVLLSPACASFDLFCNYEDRGRQFKAWVKKNL